MSKLHKERFSKLEKIVFKIYQRMFKEADPSADFEALIEDWETLDPDWFMDYYLPESRQDEIINEECSKLSKHEKQRVSEDVIIGVSPRCVK